MQTIMNNFKGATRFQGEQMPPSLTPYGIVPFGDLRFAVGKMIQSR